MNNTHFLVQANKNGYADLPQFFSTETEALNYIESDKRWNRYKRYYLYEIDNKTNAVVRRIDI